MQRMDTIAVCAICRNPFAVSSDEALTPEVAEQWLLPAGSFVCFWCECSVNCEPGDPLDWPQYGHA